MLVSKPPAVEELRQLLEIHHPASVLQKLAEAGALAPIPSSDLPAGQAAAQTAEILIPAELLVCQAEALSDLDRPSEAMGLLNAYIGRMEGPAFSAGLSLQAQIATRAGWQDTAILLGLQASRAAQDDDGRALALALTAGGYACKGCWGLSDQYLRDALEISPTNPRILATQARIRLEADQRLEARSVYERLANLPSPWARPVALWGLSYTAYLLGEFERAETQARAALALSSEFVPGLFILAQVALVRSDLPALQNAIAELERRSPQAESLPWFKSEAQRLQARLADPHGGRVAGRRFRLAAFPTLVQRRNYCGPSTVELVLRYWQVGPEFSNDLIADKVKYARGGTPIFRMREFFGLAGFSTIRCKLPVGLLKRTLNAGFPVIVQLEFSNTSHVAVAIGYDDEAGTLELQDPMTHAVTATPAAEFNQRRLMFQDSAVIAFPAGRGLEQELARLNVFEDSALIQADQAILELEQEHFAAAAQLAEKALKRHPALPFAWLVRLHAALEGWRAAHEERWVERPEDADPPEDTLRSQFYNLLQRAQERLHSNLELVNHFEGWAALLDGDYERALAAFQDACQSDPDDAANHASLAECLFALRAFDKAFEEAKRSLEIDASLVAGNIWMARCLAFQADEDALHYARSAVDLAPASWLAHLTLAEAAFRLGDPVLAFSENDRALSLGVQELEPTLQRGLLLAARSEYKPAEKILHNVLNSDQALSPAAEWSLRRTLAQITLAGGKPANALAQVEVMLQRFPQDAWCAHFQAVAKAQALVNRRQAAGQTPDHLSAEENQELEKFHDLFSQALALNPDNPEVLYDYLEQIELLGGPQNGPLAALEALANFETAYPQDDRLVFLKSQLLMRAGDGPQAAEVMLQALCRPGAILNRDELSAALQLILDGLEVETGIQRILALPDVTDGVPQPEKWRILGLLLVEMGGEQNETAASLLHQALEADPGDAAAILALGKIAQSEEDREGLFRRALLLEPAWLYARQNLAEYLIGRGRPADALGFTRGYESAELGLLLVHGRALLAAGLYEEAAAALTKAIDELEEPESDLYYALWQAELRSGWGERSARTARKALRLYPEEARWYLCCAESLRSLENYTEAERMVRMGRKHGLTQADVLRAQYENAHARQDRPAAMRAVDSYLEFAEDKRGDGRLGWAESARLHLLMEMGYLEEALVFLDSENLGAEGWGEAAQTAMRAGEPGLALEFAGHALHLEPENYAGLYTRAQAEDALGREGETLNALYALLDAYPDDHHAYEQLSLRLALDGELEQALQYAERGVALGSFCPFAWGALGAVYFLNGQPEDALQDLLVAYTRADLQHRQKSKEYWYLLARLQGKTSEAERLQAELAAEMLTPFRSQLLSRFEF